VLKSGKADFEGRCNTHLARFGYEMELVIDGKEVRWKMGRTGKPKYRLGTASKGELAIAQWALSCGYQAPGTAMLATIDDVDGLDFRNKSQLFAEVKGVVGTFGPILMAGHYSHPQTPDLAALAKGIAPIGVVWVEAGTVRMAEQMKTGAAA
jgi:hypothetical protein